MSDMKVCTSDLVDEVADKNGFTKKDVKKVVDDFISAVSDHLAAGDVVSLQNLGRLYTHRAQARTYRGIHTDQPRQVGDRNLPKMRYSKGLVERVKAST